MKILTGTSIFLSLGNRMLMVILLITWPTLEAADWYVKAGADSNGNGSRKWPFNSLQQVESASGRGDTIYVLEAPPTLVLDGGIQLKSSQKSDTPRGAGGLMSWAVSKTAGPWV